jgi:hypothetical protein
MSKRVLENFIKANKSGLKWNSLRNVPTRPATSMHQPSSLAVQGKLGQQDKTDRLNAFKLQQKRLLNLAKDPMAVSQEEVNCRCRLSNSLFLHFAF